MFEHVKIKKLLEKKSELKKESSLIISQFAKKQSKSVDQNLITR